jgi:hypothetical protein
MLNIIVLYEISPCPEGSPSSFSFLHVSSFTPAAPIPAPLSTSAPRPGGNFTLQQSDWLLYFP